MLDSIGRPPTYQSDMLTTLLLWPAFASFRFFKVQLCFYCSVQTVVADHLHVFLENILN